MIGHYPIAKNEDAYHIGMLHGSLAGDDSHAVYAPFTKRELLAKQYDYWALGHIHLRQHLHDRATNYLPRKYTRTSRNERGVKGFYEVELSTSVASLEFIPTSAIVFDRLEISCAGIRHANEWFDACLDGIDSFKAKHRSGIIELQMKDIDSETAELFNQSSEEEWLQSLREVVGEDGAFIWVQKITFENQDDSILVGASGALTQSVFGMMDEWTEDDWKVVLKDVYQHARGSKYLAKLTADEIQEVKDGAIKIVTTELSERNEVKK